MFILNYIFKGVFLVNLKKSYNQTPQKVVNLSIIGYCLVLISFIGFFAYYLPSNDATAWQWILTLLLGSGLLAYKNKNVKKEKRNKSALHDLLYFLLLYLLASISLPYGINFVLIVLFGAVLIIPLLKYSLEIW